MNLRKQWLLRLFLSLFTVSIAMTVIPGSYIYSYGLLGEITSISVSEAEADHVITPRTHRQRTAESDSIIQCFNLWLLLGVILLVHKYLRYSRCLPHLRTMITLKVRMNC